ncbi:hypothetical protein T484DRAFT_1885272 [Baffinella frigidus]|nr:hypothetical protein T484DRAFT_1885272 [Cryptophyta sp. CCMP2293]
MGNKCTGSSALDVAPPDVQAPPFFALRYPEKYRCVRELEAAATVLWSVGKEAGLETETMVWDDFNCISHRSVVNCLENQIQHIKASVVEGRMRSVRGRKQVSVCEAVEVIERWGDAGAFLFASDQPRTPPSSREDPPASAPANWASSANARVNMGIDAKARLSTASTLGTCWEGAEEVDDLSGASTPVAVGGGCAATV